ncbi:hypothetical protein cypCar_00015929 [Cyprinus carpio]|nr:hypothetical protein cypCar_00015929 [Cyprinus carpio]
MVFIKEESDYAKIEEAFRVKHEDTEEQQTEMAFIKEESEDMKIEVKREDPEEQTEYDKRILCQKFGCKLNQDYVTEQWPRQKRVPPASQDTDLHRLQTALQPLTGEEKGRAEHETPQRCYFPSTSVIKSTLRDLTLILVSCALTPSHGGEWRALHEELPTRILLTHFHWVVTDTFFFRCFLLTSLPVPPGGAPPPTRKMLNTPHEVSHPQQQIMEHMASPTRETETSCHPPHGRRPRDVRY